MDSVRSICATDPTQHQDFQLAIRSKNCERSGIVTGERRPRHENRAFRCAVFAAHLEDTNGSDGWPLPTPLDDTEDGDRDHLSIRNQ